MTKDDTRELRLTMKLSNNRIRAKREALGLSVREAAQKCGVSLHTWYAYEALRAKPYGKQGGFGAEVGWTPSADKIAMFFGVTCEWLWPDQVLAVTNPKIEQEIDADDLRPMLVSKQVHAELPSPEEAHSAKERAALLDDALQDLRPIENYILRHRFGIDDDIPKTQREIGELLDICGTRVGQIEARAIRKLRESKALAAEAADDP
jgi:RNA polymerase primary sigma factor